MTHRRFSSSAVAAALLLAAAGFTPARAADAPARAASAEYRLGDKPAPRAPAAVDATRAADFKAIRWDDLVPKDWDPMKGINIAAMGAMRDGDPRTNEMFQKLKQAWDQAPAVPAMDKTRVRIPGFVVPLEGEGGALREFLLVPYFGACIHTPPPPANQVIHVILASPVQGFRTMDAVWLSGQLRIAASDTEMGAASYQMDGMRVEPYKPGRN